MSRRPKKKRLTSKAPLRASSTRLWVVLSAVILGVVLSAWLTWLRLSHVGQGDSGSVCNLGGYLDCDAVSTSRFADWWGVPIAYLGLAFYLTLGAIAVRELLGKPPLRTIAYARGLGLAAVLFSGYLAYVSAIHIQALCIFCVGLYGVNLVIAVAGWWRTPRGSRFFEVLRRDMGWFVGGRHAWPARVGLMLVLAGAVASARLGHADEIQPNRVHGDGAQNLTYASGQVDGPEEPLLTVVEFSDFECPHCRRASSTLEKVRETFRDEVRFVFKHFPLDSSCNDGIRRGGHARACLAADAAVCAGEQDRFWPFEKELFARGVDEGDLEASAVAAELDVERWRRCRWSRQARSIVEADVADGHRLGVRGTPTFVIGEELVTGPQSEEKLTERIRRNLEHQSLLAQQEGGGR